jgi:hypothetical protein
MAYYACVKNCSAEKGTFHGDFVCTELRMYFLLRPQARQCAYNVTLRRVRGTIVAVEKR